MFAPPNRAPKAAAKTAARVARMQRPTIEARFETFCIEHPVVLTEMLRLARARLDRGETYISSKALWEECRVSLRVAKNDGYKLNNDFTACMARRLIELEPRLSSVIELRRRKSP